jgi:predicted TIM-barrel fold metal-dependent hydrolase
MRRLFISTLSLLIITGCPAGKLDYVKECAAELPIIDAHNQSDQHISYKEILALMDEARVARVVLSQRGRTNPEDLISFASRHPDRITPAVRTKGSTIIQVKEQIRKHPYSAMAEVLMWHRKKKRHIVTTKTGERVSPPQVLMPPDHPKNRKLLAIAIKKNWPFIPHIEFASSGDDYGPFMAKLEDMLRSHPNHPFILIHMGMLQYEEVKRLIETHPNIHFITAGSDPITVAKSDNPFTPMFDGSSLAPEWKKTMTRHPDCFLLGLDSVWAKSWRKLYVRQVAIWRKALKELPPDVAHAVAHRNAERLWNLPPAK